MYGCTIIIVTVLRCLHIRFVSFELLCNKHFDGTIFNYRGSFRFENHYDALAKAFNCILLFIFVNIIKAIILLVVHFIYAYSNVFFKIWILDCILIRKMFIQSDRLAILKKIKRLFFIEGDIFGFYIFGDKFLGRKAIFELGFSK